MIRKGKIQMYISMNKLTADMLTKLMNKVSDSASNVIASAIQCYAEKIGVQNDAISRT